MANVDNPHGCRPLGISLGGGPELLQKFSKIAGYGTAIFMWDAVNRVADGSIEASATPGTTPYTGVSYNYGAISTATDHLVNIDPGAMYEAQDEGTGIAAADMGLNANLVLTAGVAATSKQSKHEINGATKDVDAAKALDIHLLNLLSAPDNAAGQWARVEFVFNKHRMHPVQIGF